MTRTLLALLFFCSGAAVACGSSSNAQGHGGDGGSPLDSGAPPDDAAVSCPVVQTANGPVQSETTDAPCKYLGIPYAAPPVGALRWKAPQPAASWTTPRPSQAASACPQVSSEFGYASTDEDCLYLNVWSANPSATAAPVMVFVHGGSFLYGSGTFGLYDGTHLAEATGHVIVTMNYRLGALGFLSNPALRAEDSTNPSAGDYAIQDQIAAFQWVQANAAAFGGDPKNVTIFGESAGGSSMFMHLVSPKSAGLFARVIVESGAGAAGYLALPQTAADQNGASFATAMGCTDASTLLTCLRATTVTNVLATTEGTTSDYDWFPAVDGFVIPSDPGALFTAGTFNRVPTLLGNNKDEGTLFVDPDPPTDDASYLAYCNALSPGQGSAIVAEYPIASFGGSYEAAASQVMTDGVFLCPTRRVARAILATGTPVFRYDFVHVMERPPIGGLGAFHGSELVFVFGNPLAGIFGAQPDELPLQTLMQGYWGNMATSGTPNGTGLFAWPPYDQANETEVVLDTTPSSETELEKAQCDFWDGIAPP
jgi:para-nitrobenzyl esterase